MRNRDIRSRQLNCFRPPTLGNLVLHVDGNGHPKTSNVTLEGFANFWAAGGLVHTVTGTVDTLALLEPGPLVPARSAQQAHRPSKSRKPWSQLKSGGGLGLCCCLLPLWRYVEPTVPNDATEDPAERFVEEERGIAPPPPSFGCNTVYACYRDRAGSRSSGGSSWKLCYAT